MSNTTVTPVNEDENQEKPTKIAKIEIGAYEAVSVCESLESFSDFTFKRILKENPESRFVAVEGTFGVDTSVDPTSVIILEKTHFTEEEVKKILTDNTHLQKLFHNGI